MYASEKGREKSETVFGLLAHSALDQFLAFRAKIKEQAAVMLPCI